MNKTKYWTNKYDQYLSKIEHYKKYPEMLPFIGKKYDSNEHSKILLIAESHYLPGDSKNHLNPKDWYNSSSRDLNKKEKQWIATRGIVNNYPNDNKSLFNRIEKALIKTNFDLEVEENKLINFAFMNGFLRPSINKKSFKKIYDPGIDKEKSVKTVNKIIDIIHPDLICFLTKFTYDSIGTSIKGKNIDIDYTPHPTCPWWYRESKKYGTGEKKFIKFIKDNYPL